MPTTTKQRPTTTRTKKPTPAKKRTPAPRWTPEQITTLLDTVKTSPTAQAAFTTVAKQLGKTPGTVQQKYYNLQKASKPKPQPKPRTTTTPRTQRGSVLELSTLTTSELVNLATQVKTEVDRRRKQLDDASKLLAG